MAAKKAKKACKHEISFDMVLTVGDTHTRPDGTIRVLVVDVTCAKCGASGSGTIDAVDIQW